MKSNLLAVVWDFDGTIANTFVKNYSVSKKIVQSLRGESYNNFHVLKSLNSYIRSQQVSTNWRTYYRDEFHLTEEQIDEAGALWTEFQLLDDTFVPTVDGVSEVIKNFKSIPQAVVSQNSKQNIIGILKQNNIENYFRIVIGYEEVDIKRQKPIADAFILCLEKLLDDFSGTVIYIGDHETDVKFVQNTRTELEKKYSRLKLISISYNSDSEINTWLAKPDYFNNDYSNIENYIRKNYLIG